jgi:hypothetical protein
LPPETDELVGEFLKISVYPFRLMSFLSCLEQRFITLADQPGAICDNPAGYGQQRDDDQQRPQAELEAKLHGWILPRPSHRPLASITAPPTATTANNENLSIGTPKAHITAVSSAQNK